MASDAAGQEGEDRSKARVFISYSRKDMAFADHLDAALKARGFESLIDRSDIYAFEVWWKRVEDLIARADTVIFVLSPDAVKPEAVALKEIAFATSLNKRLAPIVFRPVDDKSVPEALAKLNFIFFDNPGRFEQSTDQLAEALNTDISWIRHHTEFGEAAHRWAVAGCPDGLRLRPPALETAEHWIAWRPNGAPRPTTETQTFIAQSRDAETIAQRRKRLVRKVIYVLLVGIILVLIGWINQSLLRELLRWLAVTYPYQVWQVQPYLLSATNEQALKPRDSFRECNSLQGKDYCPEMVVIPAGSFLMGSPPNEQGRYSYGPQHTVTIAKSFAVSKFELTFDEWDACVTYGDCPDGVSDADWGRGRQPAINISWYDAQRYVAWLAKMTGRSYRLLTEAEHEYAMRAGTQAAYPWGDAIGTNNANCRDCGSGWDSRHRTAPVGSFSANGFGLYDMVGNVWQWVEDCFHPDYDEAPTDGSPWTSGDCSRRVVRGGSWNGIGVELRAARNRVSPDGRENDIGLRIGRTLGP
jgi:formylglycine-generating enzyme required for sulfatase activity